MVCLFSVISGVEFFGLLITLSKSLVDVSIIDRRTVTSKTFPKTVRYSVRVFISACWVETYFSIATSYATMLSAIFLSSIKRKAPEFFNCCIDAFEGVKTRFNKLMRREKKY